MAGGRARPLARTTLRLAAVALVAFVIFAPLSSLVIWSFTRGPVTVRVPAEKLMVYAAP